MNKRTLVLLVAEYNADGDLLWHIVSTNHLRVGDLSYKIISAPPDQQCLLDAYWTRFMLNRVIIRRLRGRVEALPTTTLRPPSPEEVSRWRNMLE